MQPDNPRKRPYDVTPQGLRLEAIFYPKFENEQPDQQIRSILLEQAPLLEVSLKHSGSLLLWSGGRRFYSKNSADNVFTLVGELLLKQHLRRAGGPSWEACSDHIQANRLTLSFEVVTTCLGDHGARPNRDFLILTAVADQTMGTFYSTQQVLELARRWSLPHNDIWMIRPDRFFEWFDSVRETGTASTVLPALTKRAQVHVASLYPHDVFQGEILEGLVVRQVLEGSELPEACPPLVPPDTPDCHELAGDDEAPVFRANLRKLWKDAQSEKGDATDNLRCKLTALLGDRELKEVSDVHIPSLLAPLADSSDTETARIARLIRKVDSLKAKVTYRVFREEDRVLCIIHAHFDQVFQTYRKAMEQGDMPLYRGFSIELLSQLPSSPEVVPMEEDVPEVLMLKMKFLPYMVRTFGIRNGLRLLKGGKIAYLTYIEGLMRRWQISEKARHEWRQFFAAWADYVAVSGNDIKESSYLDALEEFRVKYDKGEIQQRSVFRGAIVVVHPDKDHAKTIAEKLAEGLDGDVTVAMQIKKTKEDKMALYCCRGPGVVFPMSASGIELGPIRKYMKLHKGWVRVLIAGCSDAEVEVMFEGPELKECANKLANLRALDCPVVEVSQSESDNEASFCDIVSQLRVSDVDADVPAPGNLFFFVGIPGCGKSQLSSSVEDVFRERLQQLPEKNKLLVLRGDEGAKKYFWANVQTALLTHAPATVIADRNAPCPSWPKVADVVAKTGATPVPIIPGGAALRTTQIEGVRNDAGAIEREMESFVYPFSLTFLALCMNRVVRRPPDSHPGLLDAGSPRPCLIVAAFFAYYCGLSAESLVDSIKLRFDGSGAIVPQAFIELAVLRESPAEELPDDLRALLVEALQTQVRSVRSLESFRVSLTAFLHSMVGLSVTQPTGAN